MVLGHKQLNLMRLAVWSRECMHELIRADVLIPLIFFSCSRECFHGPSLSVLRGVKVNGLRASFLSIFV